MASPEVLAEALSAAEGGAISTAVLYPLEVIKTVIQASKTKEQKQSRQATTTAATEDEQTSSAEGERNVAAAAAAVAASAADPLSGEPAPEEGDEGSDEDSSVLTTQDVAKEIYRRAGLGGFFGGVQYSSLQSSLEKSIYFYAYSTMKGVVKVLNGGRFGVRENLLVGYLSEVVHLPVTVPIEVVVTRIITSQGRLKSWTEAAKEVLKEGGPSGLYKGIPAYGVLCLKPAIQYTLFEQLRRGILSLLSRRRGVPVRALSAWQAFLLGALSRALATLIIFPWIRVRKMLMAQGKGVREGEEGGREGGKEATVLFTLQKTLRDEGVPGLYRGMAPELTRGVLSAALMLMIKERLYDFNKRMLLRTMRT
ncbi:hypothetical protein NSK_003389 [Nannochloropsis salina CCMP1776]|uniref:Uncharacterized protein n=1 Tax=Nannochloropsis salina CCMP1776 TaxID=1027361 RepID=A0A4D9D0X9_9STRA|nr:hypothetical protein NSK_003389 [Nannochloropsis salina CCMP1776]|eukprot:TFJ85341.1 hypothetical protein NSK_003389 [Nannochloropsis salina CCMP1776]